MGWPIGPAEAEAIALGAGILGTGGGGNPYMGKLRLLLALKGGAQIGNVGNVGVPDKNYHLHFAEYDWDGTKLRSHSTTLVQHAERPNLGLVVPTMTSHRGPSRPGLRTCRLNASRAAPTTRAECSPPSQNPCACRSA